MVFSIICRTSPSYPLERSEPQLCGPPPQSFLVPTSSLCFLSPRGWYLRLQLVELWCPKVLFLSSEVPSYHLYSYWRVLYTKFICSHNWIGFCLQTGVSQIKERRMNRSKKGRDGLKGRMGIADPLIPCLVFIPGAFSYQPSPWLAESHPSFWWNPNTLCKAPLKPSNPFTID